MEQLSTRVSRLVTRFIHELTDGSTVTLHAHIAFASVVSAGDIDLTDGGAVTQETSATTGVTLSTHSGAITTVSLANAAGVDHSFTLTNTVIGANDLIIVHTKTYGGTSDGIPIVSVQSVAAGSCILNVRNTGAVALDALMVISFAVFGGAVT